MEETCSSETSVLTRATRRHIPEDGTLHNHSSENLKIVQLKWSSHSHHLSKIHFIIIIPILNELFLFGFLITILHFSLFYVCYTFDLYVHSWYNPLKQSLAMESKSETPAHLIFFHPSITSHFLCSNKQPATPEYVLT
jgi:hypothetical protein